MAMASIVSFGLVDVPVAVGWLGSARISALSAESVTSRLAKYLLNPAHEGGGAQKAAWFERALGYTQENLGQLAKQIRFDATKATSQGLTKYGEKFTQVTKVVGANGKEGEITSVWQIDSAGKSVGVPRLITAKDFKIVD
jgi:hypothetical protein